MEATKCDNFYKDFWTSKKSIRSSFFLLYPEATLYKIAYNSLKNENKFSEICIKLISLLITIFYPQIYFAISKQFCIAWEGLCSLCVKPCDEVQN